VDEQIESLALLNLDSASPGCARQSIDVQMVHSPMEERDVL
jgi:hypothetical protein